MTTSLIVDDRRFIAEIYRGLLQDLGHEVVVRTDPTAVDERVVADHGLDVAFVDLSFADHEQNGLDVLLRLHQQAPDLPLVVLSQADEPFQGLLRCLNDALPLRGLISKDLLPEAFSSAVRSLLAGARYVDPLMQMYLPVQRDPARSLAAYPRLIGHAGHARLWAALATASTPPDYATLSRQLGTKHNTVKNYRDDLATLLLVFGIDDVTSLVELHRFARTARPFLLHAARPYLKNGTR